ncbi:DNA-binding CsgD family transcriptional regulator [Hydrogenophaga palleronii]|uniref:DNA-binding CsgD family transcriptional regulator n=2 Tax=Hydrogenophaga palleronii TaxID=65655 RepID=A0ABU1WRZ7_9BURK|nr:DNA-binding CsgD family transcriptional regulator [Hydrogenophaga palleronii]
MSTGLSLSSSIDLMAMVLDSKTEQEFLSTMTAASQKIGFERFLIGTQWYDDNGTPVHKIASGYPSEWQRVYAERQYIALDPTISHCQTSTEALVWTESLFENAGTLELLEEAKSHGVGFGLSVPVHEARGVVKSMISLVRDRPLTDDPRETDQLLAAGKVLASCAHFAYRGLIASEMAATSKPRLSSQESQCLRWVAMGKTSVEIGQIMSIAEPTVVFHVKHVMEKLDVKNRSQAIAVAFRLGLLA